MKKVCGKLLIGMMLCLAFSIGFASMQAEAAPKLNKKNVTLTVGQKVKLKVKGTKKKVKWSSTKKSVCTVKNGTVTAKKKGTATIKAKVAKKTLKCKVTVKAKKKPAPAPTPAPTPVAPTALSVTGPLAKLAPGGTMQLSLGYIPANAQHAAVKWSTSNSRRATVTSTGLVTAVGTGEVTITAELESNWRINGKFTFTVENFTVDGQVSTADGGDLLLSEDSSRAVYNYTVSYMATNVQTQVVDALDNVVRTYPMGTLSPAVPASVSWDLKDAHGNKVPAGNYCFRVVIAGGTTIKSSSFQVYLNSEFGTGNGSARAPYEISSLEMLQKVTGHNGAHFKQTADIDLESKPFLSMFTTDVPFTGTYDGGGHAIRNIISSKSDEDNIGIFRAIGVEGTVQNLVIDGCTFNGKGNVSAIAGINQGHINDCVVKHCNFVASNGKAGGIAAENSGVIQKCNTESNIINATTSGGRSAGGICASSNGAVISCNSKSDTVAVVPNYWGWVFAGGIVGNNQGNIVGCEVASAQLRGTNDYNGCCGGGVAGYNSANVSGCKITDLTVEGDWQAKGGVIGQNKAINDRNDYDGTGALDQVGTN